MRKMQYGQLQSSKSVVGGFLLKQYLSVNQISLRLNQKGVSSIQMEYCNVETIEKNMHSNVKWTFIWENGKDRMVFLPNLIILDITFIHYSVVQRLHIHFG